MAMDILKNKVLQQLQKTPARFLKELREFDGLIKAIGECKSKSEEDRIILAEIDTLKQRLADPKIDKARGREYMVRLIYCEMLGHDVSWAYVKALQFASEPNILTKKAAYLALTQFFDQNHELVLLLVNTLLSDLKSDNFINVSTALVVCTKLIGPDLINAVYPLVVDRLKHPKEQVRKKAIMALHRFYQLDPKREGPLAGLELDKHFRTMLCDKDPGVMSAALCALHDVIKADPSLYKNLIPSFISILKQVAEHRLPKSYDYHRFPAPFIQIKLLKILALLGAGDRAASENMYAVVQQALRRANSAHTIGNALLFECVTTITSIFPNPHLLTSAAEAVAVFLKSPSHNLRYVGVDALAGIVKINPQAAQEHQLAVVDCLEDPDDTLRLKTLELLYKMTKASNVEVIVERMVLYLRSVTDDHVKRDIVRKVSELAERYAPSPAWFIRVVSEVLELGGDHVEASLVHALTRLIAEQDQELHRSAVEQYSRLLDLPQGHNLPDVLLQVMIWVLGEYGSLLAASSGPQHMTVAQLQSKLVSLVARQKCSDTSRQLLLPALAKLSVQAHIPLSPEAAAWVHKASASQSTELQQRAYELQALLTATPQVQSEVLPHDASCEDIDEAELEGIRSLNFISWYIDQALQSGAAPYQPHRTRAAPAAQDRAQGGALRFEAYEPAPAPPSGRGAATAASAYNTGGGASPRVYGGDDVFGVGAGDRGTGFGGGAPAAAPAGPQLMAAVNKAGPKWGPAQFESSSASSRPAAGSLPSSAAAAGAGHHAAGDGGADLLGDHSHAPGPAGRRETAPVSVSERDRLAASLFAGLGGAGGARGAGQQQPQQAAAKLPPPPSAATSHKQQAAVVDLLSLDDGGSPSHAGLAPAGPRSAPQQQPQGLDFLMDLSSPTAPTAAATAATATGSGGAAGLGSLLGSPLAANQKPPQAGSNATAGLGLSLDNLLGDLGSALPALPALPVLPSIPGASPLQQPSLSGQPQLGGLGGLGASLGQGPGMQPAGALGAPGFTGQPGVLGMGLGPTQPGMLGSIGMGLGMQPQQQGGGGMGGKVAGAQGAGLQTSGLSQRGVTSSSAFQGLAQQQLSAMKPAAGAAAVGGAPLLSTPQQQQGGQAAPAAQAPPSSKQPVQDIFADLI